MMYLVIDANNLATRVFMAMPGMSEPGTGVQKGAIFGFLTQVRKLRDRFASEGRVVFCFDSDNYKRRQVFPSYKHKEKFGGIGTRDKKYLRPQIQKLREEILPQLGFRNVFVQDGYEADDLVAAVCESYQVKQAVIASSDKDLFQCLRNRPGKEVTQYRFTGIPIGRDWLFKEYGVYPEEWARVKSIAGDDGDDVTGVPMVGIRTAAKFVAGTLAEHRQDYRAIEKNEALIARNLKLVTLPLEGCEVPELQEDADTPSSWHRVANSLGLQLR